MPADTIGGFVLTALSLAAPFWYFPGSFFMRRELFKLAAHAVSQRERDFRDVA
jgi:hypothetical protein